jgi:uncharacterized membrane protein YedE/YeeE
METGGAGRNSLRKRAWSPYVVGAGIGILSWFAFASVNKPIGITTAFENTAALTEKAAAPQIEQRNSYFAEKAKENKSPKIDWEWMLVLGVFAGSFLSSKLSGDRSKEKVPALWSWRFGPGVGKRFAGALTGGALMMFGARVAQGCTSGHGISGALQLALSSWIFVALLFASAVLTTFLIFGKEARNHV